MNRADTIPGQPPRLLESSGRPSGRRLPSLIVFSLLLHLGLLALLLLTLPAKSPPEPLPPPAVAMVFEGGSRTAPTVPDPTPYSSTAAPAAQPAPAPVPPPLIVPPASVPQPDALALAPPPPLVSPPLISPPTAPPPVSAPPAELPPAPSVPTPPLAVTPPAAAPAPRPVEPRPAEPRRLTAPARPVVPRQPRNDSPFSAPMALSYGSTARPAEPAPSSRAPSSGRQALNLAPGQIARGAFDIVPLGHGRSQPGPDWRNALSAWIEAHKYYPEQAAMNGEDGTVVVRVVVDRSGEVESVQLESRSGSQWLDMAAQAIFRDAHLPPFTPDMTDPQFTFDLTMHYILIRR